VSLCNPGGVVSVIKAAGVVPVHNKHRRMNTYGGVDELFYAFIISTVGGVSCQFHTPRPLYSLLKLVIRLVGLSSALNTAKKGEKYFATVGSGTPIAQLYSPQL
jgi:hypothetical protein